KEVVEFPVPGRVCGVVDHVGRLPGSHPSQFSIHSLEGQSVKTAPDLPSANYTPGDASDQTR
ncbi:hypothetical protein ACWD7F_39720, partial [Streptomyces sp. NPDC005122]